MTNIPNRYQISASTLTSPAWFVGDFRLLTVSITTSTSGLTNVVLQGSNADGMQAGDLGGLASNLGWSNITVVQPGSLNQNQNVGTGLFTFDPPGWRWIRSVITTNPSGTTIIFTGARF
jgi:hypothetical protein